MDMNIGMMNWQMQSECYLASVRLKVRLVVYPVRVRREGMAFDEWVLE